MASGNLIRMGGSPPEGIQIPNYIPATTVIEEETPLAIWKYLWLLRCHWISLSLFVITITLAVAYVSTTLTPIYEASSIVNVDRQAPGALVGQEASRTVSINDADQFLATQVKLIQSDGVLRPVEERFHLLDHEKQLEGDNADPLRLARGPLSLKNLKVTRAPNTFLLMINYRSPDPELAANVSNSIANSYLEHTFTLRVKSAQRLTSFMEQQLEELRAKMERSNLALVQFERELNVINPEEKTNILSARLLQLNSEYTGAQSDRVRKEAAFNSMKSGDLAAAQVSVQGEALAKLTERLNEAQQKMSEVSTTFGRNHPEYLRAASQVTELTRQLQDTKSNVALRIEVDYRQAVNREEMLQKAVGATKDEADSLNARSFEYKRLKDEAEADRTLFDQLTAKVREAGVNAGYENSTIRIADLARPPAKPVWPNIPLAVSLAFAGSLLLGIASVIAWELSNTTVRDPEQTSRLLGIDVIGVLPSVRTGSLLTKSTDVRRNDGWGSSALASSSTKHRSSLTSYQEAIRTVRNTILLSDMDRPIRSVLVASAFPKEGKSTTAINLALAHAEQGRRALIIDADLRRPVIHKRLEISSEHGLADVLQGRMSWMQLIQRVPQYPNVDVLPAGQAQSRPTDMFGSAITQLLEQASANYDLVIIDAPPTLGFAESLQIATAVDAVIVVAKAGKTNRKAVATVLTFLRRARANVLGVVLNQYEAKMGADHYSYGYYGYYGAEKIIDASATATKA